MRTFAYINIFLLIFLFSCEKSSSEQDQANLSKSLNQLKGEIDSMNIEIERLNKIDFYKKDENLRNKITLPPISNDIRKMGIEFDFIYGHWIYNQDLFYNEMKRLDEPKIDMSLYFNKVEMIFYNDGSFISYLDDQVTRGEWEIDDEHLSLKPDNQAMISYDYTINDSALYIYDRDYILAFSKRIISE